MNLLIGRDDYLLTSPVACSAGRLEQSTENVDQSKRSGPPSPFKKCISGISLPSNLRNLISDKDSQIAAARNSSGKRKYVTPYAVSERERGTGPSHDRGLRGSLQHSQTLFSAVLQQFWGTAFWFVALGVLQVPCPLVFANLMTVLQFYDVYPKVGLNI